jgi:hypothetical protein
VGQERVEKSREVRSEGDVAIAEAKESKVGSR